MKHLTLLLATSMLVFGLPACSDKSSVVETKDFHIIDMVATHAVDLDISVAQLTFVPNSVAPWLGRIILLDDNGRLYSTDIEGRAPKLVGTGKYIDIFGLAREAAPGVFLAINIDNQIEAFIESDNDGNFSPMIYSGEGLVVWGFDIKSDISGENIKLINQRGKLHTVEVEVEDNILVATTLHLDKSTSEETPSGPDVALVGSKLSGKIFSVFANEFINSDKVGLIIAPLWPTDLFLFKANIKNGLSVRGLDHIKYVASTQSNYGGGAYADGVLALVDMDENRIVFISLGYADRKLLEAVNPPEDTSQ